MEEKMIEKTIEEAKKVNLTELFYDLVFVFGISKITHILHSLERGILSLNEIIIYIVVFVCFINVWNHHYDSSTNACFIIYGRKCQPGYGG